MSSVLGQTKLPLLDAASFLELNVDGERGLVARPHVDPHLVHPELRVDGEEQTAQLPLESLVEVEVDEGVVDVGAFGEEGREHEARGRHVPVLLVEDEEEGHHGIRGPGDHEAQADAEKHLEEETTENRKLRDWKHV